VLGVAASADDVCDIISYTPFEIADQTFTGNTIMTNGDNTAQLTLISTDADASVGPFLDLYRNSSSPADNDIAGKIQFNSRNDNTQDVIYSEIYITTPDVSDGSEDGQLHIDTMVAGTSRSRVKLTPSETVFNENSVDLDFRVESDGIDNMLFVNGGTNQVSIGGDVNGAAALHVVANHTAAVSNSATMLANTTFSVNGNNGEGSDTLRIGPDSVGNGSYFIEVSNSTGGAAYQLLLNPINGGSVGINTLTPENTFHVKAAVNGDYAGKFEHDGNAPYGIEIDFSNSSPDSASREFLFCHDATESKCIIHSTGNITNRNNSYTGISDVKLKENIVDANSQWDDLKALRVRNFSFKSAELDAPNMIGLIAQEVEAAGMNGLVDETPDRDDDMQELDTITKNVKYSILYMKAIKALQEAMTRIETLEAKVTVLEG
jgi:hypothetical protein